MKVIALGALLGVMLLQWCADLPSAGFTWLLLGCTPLVIWWKPLRFPLAIACGFLWALFQAHNTLQPGLDPSLEGKAIAVTGVIASIPEMRGYITRFLFDIERVHSGNAKNRHTPKRVRLSWYGPAPDLALGERWRLIVRLKRPWGFMNPGGFDYEGWLYSQGIRATGYVRDDASARLLLASFMERPIGRLRQMIADAIARRLRGSANTGVITALAIGEGGDLDPERWQLLLATGTNHLLAISGMNIALVAGLVYFLIQSAWSVAARWCLVLPAPRAAAIAALAAGLIYGALAGFSIPTQRAVIMLAVVMGALIFNRSTRPGQVLSVALAAVLAWNSAAVLSVGFWLSFAAVAIIVYTMRGRPRQQPRWWQGIRLQWVLTVGLIPLTLFFFQRCSLISPVANLIAVPWIGLVIGPLILVAVGCLPLAPNLATVLLVICDHGLELLWRVLEGLAALPFAQWHHEPVGWTLWPAALGAIWLLAPRGWPSRWIGIVLLAPLALVAAKRPEPGAYRMTLLDVGQGLSAVIETHNHVLVYDTGPRFSDYFNAGDAVVIPFLQHEGIKRIDTLLISHGDEDHSGGAEAVVKALPVARVLTSAPTVVTHARIDICWAGQRWRWDRVDFEILYPTAKRAGSENNLSCVLRVSGRGGAVLLTGDIEADAEMRLLRGQADKLASDVLIVPHHGSNTSSGAAFIRAVNPEFALVPVGYANRYGFPAPEVVGRYRDQNIFLANTGTEGALTVDVRPHTGVRLWPGYRQTHKHYWTTRP